MKNWYLKITHELENQIWEDCIFIFDTSALLDFYLYSKPVQDDIFQHIFEKLQKRLWIANWSSFEFAKHKETKIYLPIQKYNDLIQNNPSNKDKGYLNKIENNIKEIKNYLKSYEEETKKSEKHPFFVTDLHSEFSKSLTIVSENYDNFKSEFNKELDKIKEGIQQMVKLGNDPVAEAITKYFSIGKDFSFVELMNIVKEGEFRYKNTLPPGYEDVEDKIGISMYGDLIIWKQILKIAEDLKKDVVLISNDTKKDWCYRFNNQSDKIERPREELISEMESVAKVRFWMYTTPQFLYKTKVFLKTNLSDDTIQEVNEIKTNSQLDIFKGLEAWIDNNFSVAEIELDKFMNENYKSIDIYITEKNGKRIGFEYRGLKINNFLFSFRLKKGLELIRNGYLDYYIILILLDKHDEDLLYSYYEIIEDNPLMKRSCEIIGIYKENNKFYTLNKIK